MIRVHIRHNQLSNPRIIPLQKPQNIIRNLILKEVGNRIGILYNPSTVVIPAIPVINFYEFLVLNTGALDYLVDEVELQGVDDVELGSFLLDVHVVLFATHVITCEILDEVYEGEKPDNSIELIPRYIQLPKEILNLQIILSKRHMKFQM